MQWIEEAYPSLDKLLATQHRQLVNDRPTRAHDAGLGPPPRTQRVPIIYTFKSNICVKIREPENGRESIISSSDARLSPSPDHRDDHDKEACAVYTRHAQRRRFTTPRTWLRTPTRHDIAWSSRSSARARRTTRTRPSRSSRTHFSSASCPRRPGGPSSQTERTSGRSCRASAGPSRRTTCGPGHALTAPSSPQSHR